VLILVDSREQKPLWSGGQCARMALLVGDYTTAVLFNKYHIERKSLQDLYGTIIQGHVRFIKEVYRAKHNGIVLEVFVEGTKEQFRLKQFPKGSERKTDGATLLKIVDTIGKRHRLKFVWFKSRKAMSHAIIRKLKLEELKYTNNGTTKTTRL